jgi:hypothetical protein
LEVEVVDRDGFSSDEGDRVIVYLDERTYDDEDEGRLVRQDGEWRVEADPHVLRVSMPTWCGQSPDCGHAGEVVALDVHDRFLVLVQMEDYFDVLPPADVLLGRAQQVLRAQIEQL